jgi:hypothetical protein
LELVFCHAESPHLDRWICVDAELAAVIDHGIPSIFEESGTRWIRTWRHRNSLEDGSTEFIRDTPYIARGTADIIAVKIDR